MTKKLLLLPLILVSGWMFAQLPEKGLILVVDFSDKTGVLEIDNIDDLINTIGYTEPGVNTSIIDFWTQQSRDSISLSHEIEGYYQATETVETYMEGEWTIVYDILKNALDSVVANHPDFDWDALSLSNRPGLESSFLSISVVVNANIPGSGGAHVLPPGQWTAPNGVPVRGFSVQTLTNYWDDTEVRLFTLAHELGHSAFGFPDTYDYDGSSFGTGFYSIMSGNQLGGELEPIGAPFFVDAGWVDVVDITPNTTYTLPQDGKLIARYINPSNPNEYFLIEACMQATHGNAAFPVERGLVIWHIDENVTSFNTLEDMTPEAHYAYSIEQADGLFELEGGVNQGNAGDIYVEGTAFSAESFPNSTWWNGAESGLNINSIQFLPDNQIQFCNGICNLSAAQNNLPEFVCWYNNLQQNIILDLGSLDDTANQLVVTDLTGRTVFTKTLDENINIMNIAASAMTKGTYIISILDVNGVTIGLKKVVVY